MNPVLLGYLIGIAFAAYWLRLGSAAVGGLGGTAILIGGGALLLAALRRVWRNRLHRIPGARFRPAWYLIAVAGEIVAINVALLNLPKTFLAAYQAPVIGAIVGLHFIGLWLATNMRRFLYLSGGMVATNLVALALPANHGPAVLAGLGSAAMLAMAVAA